MKNIIKILFVFIFSFGIFSFSNATGNLPKAVNNAAKKVASPTEVRNALNKKFPQLKNKYCDDYWKSGDGVAVWCSGSYRLTKADLYKITNPNSKWGPYLPVNLNNLQYTPSQVRNCIKKKYSFDVTHKYSDYRSSRGGIALWTSGKADLKLSRNELKNCENTPVLKCGIDLYKVGNSCQAVGVGFYSPNNNNSKIACTNAPANANYTSDGNGTNNCSWTCNTNYEQSGNSCILTPEIVEIIIGSDTTVEDSRVAVFGSDNTIDISYNNIKPGAVFSISGHPDFSINSSGVISYTGDVEPSNETTNLTVSVTNLGEATVSKTFSVTILNND